MSNVFLTIAFYTKSILKKVNGLAYYLKIHLKNLSMKLILPSLLLFLFVGCGSVKKTERALNSGNYDNAISIAIKNLQTNKHKKRKQEYIVMLEQAYKKAVIRDNERIHFLRLDGNPKNKGEIYETYVLLHDRQEAIKPLLPLKVLDENRDAVFEFKNYDSQRISVKDEYSDYLYTKGKYLVENATSKDDYRLAYEELRNLEKLNPNYLNTNNLIQAAYKNGVDYVLVRLKNSTEILIPKRLESDLLSFGTYGMNNIWIEYHNKQVVNQKYDYELVVDFRSIKISPEQVKEKQIVKEKEVVDGWEYLLDENDDQVRNEKGEKIKVDKLKKVRFEYLEFTQFKSVEVAGNVSYFNLQSGQLLNNFPLKSEYVFSHIYATGSGDKRALESDVSGYLEAKSIDFPTDEQMIYDSGEDLKNNLKSILSRYNFK